MRVFQKDVKYGGFSSLVQDDIETIMINVTVKNNLAYNIAPYESNIKFLSLYNVIYCSWHL